MIEHLQRNTTTLELFRESKRYKQMEARYKELMHPARGLDPTRLKRDFSGALFEHVAYTHLEVKTPSHHQILLDPEETLNYYHEFLYPTHRLSHHAFTTSLHGVSVPDAMLLSTSRNKPLVIFETTLSKNPSVFSHKFNAYLKNRQLFPDFFSKSRLVFVTPHLKDKEKSQIVAAVDPEEVTLQTLSFTHTDFKKFKDTMLAQATT